MWTYIELTSAADYEERLAVITSLATPCLITRRAARHRSAAPPAASPGHQSRGRRLISVVRSSWHVAGRRLGRIAPQRTAASTR